MSMSPGWTPASATPRGDRGGCDGQIGHLRDVSVGMALAASQYKYRHLFQVPGAFLRRYQHGASTVADDTAVEQVQGVGNHARVEHILHGDRLAVHGKRIEAGMPARYDGDFGELFRSGAVLVHVAACCHRIGAYECNAVRSFIRCLRNGCGPASRAEHTPTAGELSAGVGDECHFALTCADRCYCVVEMSLK